MLEQTGANHHLAGGAPSQTYAHVKQSHHPTRYGGNIEPATSNQRSSTVVNQRPPLKTVPSGPLVPTIQVNNQPKLKSTVAMFDHRRLSTIVPVKHQEQL